LGTSNTSHIQDISQSIENSANLHELDDRSQSLNLLETEASPEDTRTTKLITNLQQDPAETDKLSQDGGRMEFNLTPTTNHQPSTINQQPSTINHQPSTINHQPSTINHQPSTINHQPSTINHQQSCISPMCKTSPKRPKKWSWIMKHLSTT
jgi:hypothetical protein